MSAERQAQAPAAPSAEELVRAFELADESFATALRKHPGETRLLDVAGSPVALAFAGGGLAEGVLPSFAHRARSGGSVEPELTICFCDAATSGVEVPLPACLAAAAQRRTGFPTYRSRRVEALYDWERRVLYLLDRELRRAIYWTADAAAVPLWEHAGALRQIFVWWLRDGPLQLLHAGAVGRADGGVLLVGRSGSGKTTATTACLGSSLVVLGDDTVLARAEPSPVAQSLYASVKLTPDGLARFPGLARHVSNHHRGSDEKAIVYLHESAPGKLVETMALRALLIPRIVARPAARLVPARSAEGLLALAPSTLFQANGGHRGAFRVLARLVERMPAYVLEVGTDPARIPTVIERLLDGEGPRG